MLINSYRAQDRFFMRFCTACERILITRGVSEYAKRYALTGKGLRTRDEVLAQIPYILSNLGSWRGPEALAVKQILRELATTTEG